MEIRTGTLDYDGFCALAAVVADLEPGLMEQAQGYRDPATGRIQWGAIDWEQLGLPLLFDLLGQANTNLRLLIAAVADVSPDEVGAIPLPRVLRLIREVIQSLKDEDWSDFLQLFGAITASQAPTSTASSTATDGPIATLAPLVQPATSSARRAAKRQPSTSAAAS